MKEYSFVDRFLRLVSTGLLQSNEGVSKHAKGRRRTKDWRKRRKDKRKARRYARRLSRPLYSKRYSVKSKRHAQSAHH